VLSRGACFDLGPLGERLFDLERAGNRKEAEALVQGLAVFEAWEVTLLNLQAWARHPSVKAQQGAHYLAEVKAAVRHAYPHLCTGGEKT
jgi:hypothetical protein